MPDVQEVFRMATQKVRPAEGFVDRQLELQRRKTRNRRNGAIALAAVIGVVAVVVLLGSRLGQDTTTPADEPSTVNPADYLLDLDTGTRTPLSESIVGADNEATQYAASPDGSALAYVAPDENGTSQIFVADLDGSGIRQVTFDPIGAQWPAWSPDGTMIAYAAGNLGNLFILQVAMGETRQVTDDANPLDRTSQFTPDGTSLLYTSTSVPDGVMLRTVPIDGGESTVLIGPGEGMGYAGNGSLSPDGSLVTMMGNEINGPGAIRFLANADGTELRQIPGAGSIPAGTWSPDGNRIVCSAWDGSSIIVVDIATGTRSRIAEGDSAIWLDEHTLLIDV